MMTPISRRLPLLLGFAAAAAGLVAVVLFVPLGPPREGVARAPALSPPPIAQADGLVVLGVAVQDSPEAIAAFADEVGATYPIVVDGDGTVAAEYSAVALPVSYWIDREGIVREWVFGELPPDLMAASLDRILRP